MTTCCGNHSLIVSDALDLDTPQPYTANSYGYSHTQKIYSQNSIVERNLVKISMLILPHTTDSRDDFQSHLPLSDMLGTLNLLLNPRPTTFRPISFYIKISYRLTTSPIASERLDLPIIPFKDFFKRASQATTRTV